jgi:hypothetical protein
MESNNNYKNRRFTFKKVFLISLASLFLIFSVGGLVVYKNLNRIISDALLKSFESNIASDIYQLNFKRLNVNLMLGSIKVKDVQLLPREKPLHNYPYINSRLRLTTEELLLSDVEILTLLRENRLVLDRIKIEKPVLEVYIDNKIPIFLPFRDSTAVIDTSGALTKKHITGFILKKFDLIDASVHAENHAKGRNLDFKNLNINLRDLLLDQQHAFDIFKFSAFSFTIDEISGHLQEQSIKHVSLKDYGLTLDSLKIKKSVDTLIYNYTDFNFGFRDLNLVPTDSSFQLSVSTLSISYIDSLINIEKLAYKSNLTEAEMRKKFKFQHTTGFSGNIGKLQVKGVNFDSLFHKQKLFVNAITLDTVSVSLFKDKTKPVDTNHLPEYLGQTLLKIKMPLIVNQVRASHVNLVSREIKPDGVSAEANVNRGEVTVSNITNLQSGKPLSMQMEAYLEDTARFKVNLEFSYQHPEFNYSGSFVKFKLSSINQLITHYAPAKITDGTVDHINFSGIAKQKTASGTMKFLYHDLKIEAHLEKQPAWKNSILSVAANTVVPSSNPVTESAPPKVVDFQIERDMNKAFVNVVIKSALTGLKETVIMSKENRKAYNETKKKAKKNEKK